MSDALNDVLKSIPKEVLKAFSDSAEQILQEGKLEVAFKGKKYSTRLIDAKGDEALIEIMLPENIGIYAYKKGSDIEYRLTPKYV